MTERPQASKPTLMEWLMFALIITLLAIIFT